MTIKKDALDNPLDLSGISIVVNGKKDEELEWYIKIFYSDLKAHIEVIKNGKLISCDTPEQGKRIQRFIDAINGVHSIEFKSGATIKFGKTNSEEEYKGGIEFFQIVD